jgi:hypothetical protein
VPTQVFTEYVRYHMITYDGKPIDGIRYRSSFDYHDSHGDRGCYVLFFEQDECMPAKGRKQSLECDKNSKRTVPLPFKAG